MAANEQDVQSRLKDALLALQKMRMRLESLEKSRREPIAIIGMGCRYPANINTPEQFWQFLRDGGDAIQEVPKDRWDIDQYFDPDVDAPGKIGTRWGGFIQQPIDRFDATFFGISPREARSMDPQQRMLLEVAWETLDHAGIAAGKAANTRTGVYIGMTMQDYLMAQANRIDVNQIDAYHTTGGVLNAAVGRISYTLGLHGPAMAVDTACSSSLVSVHLAVQALRNGECDLALAGGSNVILVPEMTVSLTKAHMLAPDGRCKTFDARADGFVRSEGCGMVALKRLSDAVEAGDRIFAVIRGSAVNHGGSSSGFTVPNRLAQSALIMAALKNAGVDPSEVSYVETHGTGTSLGDPIEIRALAEVLRKGRTPENPLMLGSVKTNFGHLEAGAGIIGLMKLALAVYHGEIPPHLHLETLNPYIAWDEMPMHIPTEITPWNGPRIGGVSSFGASGTNAHIIVEAGPQEPPLDEESPERAHLLTISALTEAALRDYAEAYRHYLSHDEVPNLHDLTYTANTRRTLFNHRLAVVAATPAEMAEALAAYLNGESHANVVDGHQAIGSQHKRAFVFSGQGPQWWAMGRQLLEQEPVFRATIEACDTLLSQYADWSLLSELTRSEEESRLDQTAIAQPAIFALQIALAELWRSWGIVPDAVVGHSVGEIAAAYVAGVLSLEDAIRVVYHRARLMQQATGLGQMMTVDLPLDEVERLLEPFADRLTPAAVNSPTSTVLSGEADALEAVEAIIAEQGIFHRRLPVNYAFHSPQMEPYRHELARELAGLQPQPAKLLLISTVTGAQSDGLEYTADYWGRNIRQPVLFAPAILKLAELGFDTFLEIAPHPVLASSIEQCLASVDHPGQVLHSLRRYKDERATMLRALGGLYVRSGAEIRWEAIYPEGGRIVSLPPYPWQRERYWVDLPAAGRRAFVGASAGELLGQRLHSPLLQDTVFETYLSVQHPNFLADHRVLGSVILSGTTFLEMASEAAAAALGTEGIALHDFLIQSPLILPEDAERTVQVIVKAGEPASIEIYSLQDDGSWQQHAAGTAVVTATEERLLPDVDLAAARERCTQAIPVDDLYHLAAERNLEFGPTFRILESLWLGDGEAVGLVGSPGQDAACYHFHPSQLDACFHPIFLLFDAANGGTYLPVSYETIRQYARPQGSVWCHTQLRTMDADAGLVDVCIWDEAGELIAEVRGLRFKAASAIMANKADFLYQIQWLPAARNQSDQSPASWLIFDDARGTGRSVAQQLQDAGHAASIVTAGDAFAQVGAHHWQIDPANRADYYEVLRAVQDENSLPLGGVIHLWSLDVPEGIVSQSQTLGAASVLLTAQALVDANIRAELWLVTCGAQPVSGSLHHPVQAAVWGLGATLALEHPELNVMRVDLDPDAAALAEGLAEEVAFGKHDEPLIAFRSGTRYIARLARSQVASHGSLLESGQPVTLEISERGVLDNLTLIPAARRAPGPGEIEIRVHATGLNFRDVLNALGMYPGNAGALGNECAGEVVAVGAGVEHLQVGDAVMAVAYGTFSTYVTTPAALAVRVPQAFSYEEAATIPMTFLTAYYALHHLANMKAGDRVLIHAAAGGVGLAAVQLALRAGAEVFGTAGSPAKRDFLAAMGVPHRLHSRNLDFADQILSETNGEGVDIVLNSLTGDFIPASLSVLRPGGHFLEIGKTGIWDDEQVQAANPGVHYSVIFLGDVIADQPDLIQSMFQEIVRGLEDGSLQPLPLKVFSLQEATDAFRYMAQARHIGKIVLSQDYKRGQIVDEATYLITGGTGGIGLQVARWLIERGARHLVLLSRRGVTDEALALADEYAGMGVEIRLMAGDVSDPDSVNEIISEISATMPPLRGIVHGAGVNADAPVMQQDAERLAVVMRPKADGALLLAEATRHLSLDFYLLFSSIAPVIGWSGQSNYAAANAYLDALAHTLRAQGIPATSINWGIWENTGMTAVLAAHDQARWGQQGLQTFTAQQGVDILADILAASPTQVIVMPVNWRQFLAQHPDPLYEAFADSKAAPTQMAAGPGLKEQLIDAPPSKHRAILLQFVRENARAVLGLAGTHTIDPLLPLNQLGLDSLMAVELRNALARGAGLTLPATLLFDYPTIDALVGYLLTHLDLPGDDITDEPDTAPEPARVDDALANMSDDEAEALLLQELDSMKKKGSR
ncbi:MAG TPA: type I polyketide synthase [Spirillospora sp.]|nr:type I polyketide synthase [Spirillospora sp.]